MLTCNNCGLEYDGSFWDFCPNCSNNVTLSPVTEQIQDSSSKPVGTNHFI